ncbi:TonB-dependent siderophore receptor [Stutzerimonas kirkiae]|uniref:TonB-dependent siderophore receptor n=1 Tax=Stutzerimonas kirkiae TaxID=2211392 RepID=UPI0010384981|nr:TonB-dependent receptor [Stutzerimonas kirkiae]TBV10460.1 TonB-dependent siderophore receptor [Stutzerimonas kirkiae]
MHTPRLRPSALALAVALSLAHLPLSALADTQSYDLPNAPLEQTLRQIARQSGQLIAADPALLQGKRSAPVHGQLDTREAVRQALAGSGLQLLSTESGAISVQPVAEGTALELGATNVTSTSIRDSATTEGTGSYTSGSMSTATKLSLSPRQTPQSVTVITRQRMDDQGMNNLEDVVKNTPGLTLVKAGTERVELYSRGFMISTLMYDGLPSSYDGDSVPSPDMAMYDRVEVVRGATGLMQGSGAPSASLNLVRKRPTKDTQVSLKGSAGSWDNYRTELDASSALNATGTVRGRVVTAYQDKQSFQDYTSNEYGLLYAIGEIDLDERTTLTVGASSQNDNNNATWGGIPTAADGSDLGLSRSTYLGNDWEYWDKESKTLFGELEHHFDNDWKLRLAASKSWVDMEYLGSYMYTQDGTTYNQMAGRYSTNYDNRSYDLFASGPFTFAGRSHELVLGASRREVSYDLAGGQRTIASGIDLSTWNPGSQAKPTFTPGTPSGYDTEQTGTYITTRLNVADPLKVILGGRLDWYENDVARGSTHTRYKVTRNVTRYAGVIYDLDKWHSVYASYTDIFEPQNARGADGGLLDPITGKNYEIGIKGEYLEGRLNASAAIFQLDQENRASVLADQTGCPSATTCYEAAGKVRSKGVELEINGRLTDNWQIAAGYTFAEAKYQQDADETNEGRLFNTKLPRHQLNLSTTYHLPGELNRWRVGASLYRQNATYSKGVNGTVDYQIEQKAYAIADAMLGYQVNEHLDTQLSINNIFDKKYYQTLASHPNWGGVSQYGAPRNFMLSAKYSF